MGDETGHPTLSATRSVPLTKQLAGSPCPLEATLPHLTFCLECVFLYDVDIGGGGPPFQGEDF